MVGTSGLETSFSPPSRYFSLVVIVLKVRNAHAPVMEIFARIRRRTEMVEMGMRRVRSRCQRQRQQSLPSHVARIRP